MRQLCPPYMKPPFDIDSCIKRIVVTAATKFGHGVGLAGTCFASAGGCKGSLVTSSQATGRHSEFPGLSNGFDMISYFYMLATASNTRKRSCDLGIDKPSICFSFDHPLMIVFFKLVSFLQLVRSFMTTGNSKVAGQEHHSHLGNCGE